jgi:hypothetical protein
MKECSCCKIVKPLIEFKPRKLSKDGYHNQCLICIKEKDRIYYENNKESILEKCKKYRSVSPKKDRSSYIKNYREKNKDKLKEYRKNRYLNNKDKENEYNKNYRLNNKDYFREYDNSYKKNRMNKDIVFKLGRNIRGLITSSINKKGFKKNTKTFNILGCSFEEFKTYLESKFEPWMNWDNKGLYNGELNYGWDIDHIIPSSSAKDEDDVIRLNHYTNLQPLCSKVNRDIKKDKII